MIDQCFAVSSITNLTASAALPTMSNPHVRFREKLLRGKVNAAP